ncbi:DUF6274 family protein [Streptomyces sp. QL37]|uniref:DUF6274 family protein n=1 Tax=Streptomyces sp. QL37 TaxID=2093747 RepID=UPI000CF1CF2C|nr:DUF6274 family protein [Streptomyces sp. QL37]PPQ58714.1 hypothetical protein C5F59_20080 [Streptomyces sp. QL37]
MSAPTERHETRALLRAHLAAASGYRHLTRHCPICHRLLRLAMEPLTAPQAPPTARQADDAAEPSPAPQTPADALVRGTPAGASTTEDDTAGTGPRTRHPVDESPPTT